MMIRITHSEASKYFTAADAIKLSTECAIDKEYAGKTITEYVQAACRCGRTYCTAQFKIPTNFKTDDAAFDAIATRYADFAKGLGYQVENVPEGGGFGYIALNLYWGNQKLK